MNRVLINGNFLCRNLTGIERFAFETCRCLDELIDSNTEFSILVPANARTIPEYKNIKLVRSKKEIHGFPFWDMGTFAKACKKTKSIGLNFSNTAPLGKLCGFSFIHDVYAKDFPGDFTSFKDKLVKLYCRISYWNIARNAKKIFTVSEFSKKRIIYWYGIPEEKIAVIPNGWEHFLKIKIDNSIFEKFPILKNTGYFFTLGSLQKRKNLKWILKYAKANPGDLFAVSGKTISGMKSKEIEDLSQLKNVVLLGYVSDEEVKALLQNCRAFVFPSYYEGFGIPPLEALAAGAKIIISKAASLPEIYKNSAVYINPNDTNINLNEILNQSTFGKESVLKKYTYSNAAEELLKEIQK
ncbi:glycosyltransferase family 1 protein [Treponema sp.]|uniref:glycosyltransferase family 4 protein n=1 Tax=Treponema sp. TaxID=166 RepID=UPI00298E67DD|nr:glycosyltransferase family 1 protein [Treponema sp.]